MKQTAITKVTSILASILSTSILLSSLATPLMSRASATTLVPTGQVSFTFDDGLASARTLAAPNMNGLPATDYIVTGCIGMTTVPNACKADGDKPYMTWPQVAELQNTYGWEIGSHTDTHPLLASTDPDDQPKKLTPAQVVTELMTSRDKLKAQGYTATDFATPYGDYEPDGHPVVTSIAKYYASHRGFGDVGYNVFPYNDYLLVDQQVLSTTKPATITGWINTAKANGQWLIITFHNIVASGAAGTEDEYDYNAADLATVTAAAKASGIRVVNPREALVTNNGNLFANSSFDSALSATLTDTVSWTTDDAVNIKQDTASNGSFTAATTAPLGLTNSVSLKANTTKNVHLYSPHVPVVVGKKYVVKQFVNIVTPATAAGEVAFYIDEYNAAGVYVGATAIYKGSVYGNVNPRIRSFNFEYTPSATVAFARLQVAIPSTSGVNGFYDNAQMFAEDGSTTTTPGTVVTGKAGDVNGDTFINALDLSILLTNYNKTAMTRAQGDLSGEGTVNALDLSILLTNWGK